ncbi:MAG TPA: hypothetical protein VJC05_02145 [Candidatus Andersenbacteria bacterium]|nr:hypothetical protein [Candidatus Andersenbacteria bacterium]
MEVRIINPPRIVWVGEKGDIENQHMVDIAMEPDEVIVFKTGYELVRKSWGYYCTPSLNVRLTEQGLRAALTKNKDARYYIVLVLQDKQHEFSAYLEKEKQEFICWMDQQESLEAIEEMAAALSPRLNTANLPAKGKVKTSRR